MYIATAAGKSWSTSSGRTRRTAGSAGIGGWVSATSSGWLRAYVAGRAPMAAEPLPEVEHRVGPADDRRADAAARRGAAARRRRRPPPAVAHTGMRLRADQQRTPALRRDRTRDPALGAPPVQAVRRHPFGDLRAGVRVGSRIRSTAARSDSPSWRTGTVSTAISLPDTAVPPGDRSSRLSAGPGRSHREHPCRRYVGDISSMHRDRLGRTRHDGIPPSDPCTQRGRRRGFGFPPVPAGPHGPGGFGARRLGAAGGRGRRASAAAAERPRRPARAAHRAADARLRDDPGAGHPHRRRLAAEPRLGLPDPAAAGGRGPHRGRGQRRAQAVHAHRRRPGRGRPRPRRTRRGRSSAEDTMSQLQDIRDAGASGS